MNFALRSVNKHHQTKLPSFAKQLHSNGFSLLEVLIAAFILAFGILSITAMQTAALKRSQNAYFQSIAVNQINNIQAQFTVGDRDCTIWQAQCAALLPHVEAKCNRKTVSLCWVDKNSEKNCVRGI